MSVEDAGQGGKTHLLVVVVVKEPRGSINLPLKHPQAMAQCTGRAMWEVALIS